MVLKSFLRLDLFFPQSIICMVEQALVATICSKQVGTVREAAAAAADLVAGSVSL